MQPPVRPTRPFIDAFTARAISLICLVIAAGMLGVAADAFATGCIGVMRGRHGPSVTHCAPERAYWVASWTLVVVGLAGAAVSVFLWRVARRQSASAAR